MTVGIIGAGQLGRMMALAGYPLGLNFLFLDRNNQTPGAQVAPTLCGEFTDRTLLQQLALSSEVLTFDWENISVEALRTIERNVRICPPMRALAVAQDRVLEKRTFEKLDIPTTRYRAVDSLRQLERALREVGLPGVLKTRRLGYDGKGQKVVRSREDAERAWAELGNTPLLYEELVDLEGEVSIIGVRSRRGEVAVYPLNHNIHMDGILRLTRAPYGGPKLRRLAATYLERTLAHFNYIGVLTIEFFVRNGQLIANEMAPRVHNSGHWTIEGTSTSQFENHLRAILNLPLGQTRALGHCAMVNIIGQMPPREELLAFRGAHLHHYGKEARPGRKLGHCTIIEQTAAERDRRARRLLAALAPGLRIP